MSKARCVAASPSESMGDRRCESITAMLKSAAIAIAGPTKVTGTRASSQPATKAVTTVWPAIDSQRSPTSVRQGSAGGDGPRRAPASSAAERAGSG